jgi:hypothetical protein
VEFTAEKEAARRKRYATIGTALFDVAHEYVEAVKACIKRSTAFKVVGEVEDEPCGADDSMTTMRVRVERKACVGNSKYDICRAVGLAAIRAGVPRLNVDVLDFQRFAEEEQA